MIVRFTTSRAFAFVISIAASYGWNEAVAHAQGGEADQTQAARALFDEGLDFADRGEWAEAADRFLRSLERRESLSVRLNLASSLTQLGRNAEAMDQLEVVLGHEGAPQPLIDLARELSDDIGPRTGRIAVEVSGIDAPVSISLDGETLPDARTQLPIRVDPGTHLIAVSRGDEVVGRRLVEVASGTTVDVHFEIAPTTADTAADPTDPGTPLNPPLEGGDIDPLTNPPGHVDLDADRPPVMPGGAERDLDVDVDEDDDTPLVRDWRLWVGVGSAAAAIAIVIGVVVGVSGDVEEPIEGNMEPGVWVW